MSNEQKQNKMEMQIKINNEKETMFICRKSSKGWVYSREFRSTDYYTTNVFYYKTFSSMIKAAKKIANEKSTITIWDSEGKGKTTTFA